MVLLKIAVMVTFYQKREGSNSSDVSIVPFILVTTHHGDSWTTALSTLSVSIKTQRKGEKIAL